MNIELASANKNKETWFVKKILKWGRKNRRMFPWRKNRTPYKVLLSEILLQRTPANRVAIFFPTLLERFPSPKSIATTEIKDFQNFLHPLGLKKRALWLMRTMKEICVTYNSEIPETEEKLINLKGIGLYTARATLVFAFNKDLAIVDVNVARVLQRVFHELGQDLARPSENKKLWSFADNLVPENYGSEYNEALLDFSALICRITPLCDGCLLKHFCDYCITHRADKQQKFLVT